jgi:hypothetical protein
MIADVAADSGGIEGDSGVIAPDSGGIALDSGIVAPDSGIVAPDSGGIAPDSGVVAVSFGAVGVLFGRGDIIRTPGGREMPAVDYVPKNDSEFVDWMENFVTVLNLNMAMVGLVAADVAPVDTANGLYSVAVTTQIQQQALAKSAVENKKTQRDALEDALRPLVRRIQNHPGMTNQLRGLLGITVMNDGGQQPAGAGIDVPSMFLETKPGQVIVHFGTDASNELHNGKPSWARGCVIWRKKTGESDFSMIAFDTASPYVDTVSGSAVDATYKVAYRGTDENDLGPMSTEQMIAAGG